MNGYIAFYRQKKLEVWAESLLAAKEAAVQVFSPPKVKRHMVSIMLVQVGEGPEAKVVQHSGSEL